MPAEKREVPAEKREVPKHKLLSPFPTLVVCDLDLDLGYHSYVAIPALGLSWKYSYCTRKGR
jgi:hypothetical protein